MYHSRLAASCDHNVQGIAGKTENSKAVAWRKGGHRKYQTRASFPYRAGYGEETGDTGNVSAAQKAGSGCGKDQSLLAGRHLILRNGIAI